MFKLLFEKFRLKETDFLFKRLRDFVILCRIENIAAAAAAAAV